MNQGGDLNDPRSVEQVVIEIVARSLERTTDEVTLNSRFWGELDAESLDMLDIIYALERRFRIRMPRLNLLQRAVDLFGEDVIIKGGIVTERGIELMRVSMPEVPAEWMKPGMRIYDFRKVITVGSFVRVVERCLEAVDKLRCSRCGGQPEGVEMTLRCTGCGMPIELPSGEQLLVQDLRIYAQRLSPPLVEVQTGLRDEA